jgi:hypothetical protein
MKTFRAFLSALFLFAALPAFGVSDDGILRQKEFNAKIGKPQQDFEMNADPAGLYKPNLV